MRWRSLLDRGDVAIAVLAVLAIGLGALALQQMSAAPAVSSLPPAVQGSPSVAFIGDSFTSGTVDGGLGPANYTALLATRNGWRVTNAAVDGAGYVVAPPGRTPFVSQVPSVLAAQPSLVVIVGGRPDSEANPDDVRAAAIALYRNLRVALPARIVVVGPIWPGEQAPPELLAVRDAVREAASAERLPFVDPIADEWFRDEDDPGLDADGRHLRDIGHEGMANLVGDGLRRTGAVPG